MRTPKVVFRTAQNFAIEWEEIPQFADLLPFSESKQSFCANFLPKYSYTELDSVDLHPQ